MASKSVLSVDEGSHVVTQGFRPGPVATDAPYVYVGIRNGSGDMPGLVLTPENANILGEYLRQEAEFATADQAVREKGE